MAAAAGDGEDPRWRRRNTDCFSFLASRFACTKGAKCEYRHCEGARFNLQGCWYWFQGNCVNPSCTFRHPPLESVNRTKSFADPLASHGSTSVKAASPCYFYYNSYCMKGDRCPFLHEPMHCNNAAGICSKATTSNPSVNVNSAGSVMIESLKDAIANPAKDSSDQIKEHQSNGVTVSSNPEFYRAIPGASGTLVDTGGRMKSSTASDQSSEHLAMEDTEQDEWRDSSPGFDVLVDDKESDKNDPKHQLVQERDANGHHVKYDGGDSFGYGLGYLDSECYEQEFCGFDSPCYPVGSLYHDRFVGVAEHDTVTTLGYVAHNRIKLEESTIEEYGYGRRFFDPRNFISSTADAGFDHQYTEIGCNSKRRSKNRKGVKGTNNHIKRRRDFASSIGSEEVESRSAHLKQYSLIGDCSGLTVCSALREQKKRSRRKKQHNHYAKSTEGTVNVKHQDYREDFAGPKTLDQIKEEKCRSKSSSRPNVCMPHVKSFSKDFEGPKSLSELLKAKSKTYGGRGIIL